jgi:hypothetical protein
MAAQGGRAVGYVVATVVGVAVGGFFGFTAFVEGLCNNWGEQCSTEENAQIDRHWKMAFGAPVVTIGAYAVLDLTLTSAVRNRGGSPRAEGREQWMSGYARLGQHGLIDGRVTVWHDDAGWGVLTSADLDGPVSAHLTNLAPALRRPPRLDQPVCFTYESPGPNGYPHQAIWVTPA